MVAYQHWGGGNGRIMRLKSASTGEGDTNLKISL